MIFFVSAVSFLSRVKYNRTVVFPYTGQLSDQLSVMYSANTNTVQGSSKKGNSTRKKEKKVERTDHTAIFWLTLWTG